MHADPGSGVGLIQVKVPWVIHSRKELQVKALLINPVNQSIEAVDIDGRDDLARLIGFETLESDAVGASGDRLFFDEECFLRGTSGRFRIDSIIPVSGKAVVAGTTDDGATLGNVATDIEDLRRRIKYL